MVSMVPSQRLLESLRVYDAEITNDIDEERSVISEKFAKLLDEQQMESDEPEFTGTS